MVLSDEQYQTEEPSPLVLDKVKRKRSPSPPYSLDNSPTASLSTRSDRAFRLEDRHHFTEDDAKTVVHILGQILSYVTTRIHQQVEAQPPASMVSNGDAEAMTTDLYCLMTGFMTVYLCFIKVLLQDLLPNSGCPLETYMGIFSQEDDVFVTLEDTFVWYTQLKQRDDSIVNDIRRRLSDAHIKPFQSLQLVDTIFSNFYTTHFLQVAAQKQQKDHGQFYTPQNVVQFMWNQCLPLSAGNLDITTAPRVLDPCMGIGAFLCEYVTRVIHHSQQKAMWNDPDALFRLLQSIPDALWGIEIDPFAYKLGKINVIVHLFPLYRQLIELGFTPPSRCLPRLCMFCNDALRLRGDTNPLSSSAQQSTTSWLWECNQLAQLRDSQTLKFDYIITNPPYMIRKTGLIAIPDRELYDERIFGRRGTQAYLYFMWICLQRCDPDRGQVCLITPSQWTVLDFAEPLRTWIWRHCRLLDMYLFEPYKVWPKVQTDSLIFRLRLRSCLLDKRETVFWKHASRHKASLHDLLLAYEQKVAPKNEDGDIQRKVTPNDDVDRIIISPHASFAFLSSTSSLSDQMMDLTSHLPRLCDSAESDAPLIWHRGPNTNPVYALVVRTRWAEKAFGQAACDRWLRPAFYWNGKSSEGEVPNKEVAFWRDRDIQRLSKKENSPAEAYVPFSIHDTDDHYSMILVDKAGAIRLEQEKHPEDASLYQYLSEARQALQPKKTDTLAWCQFNKCGIDVDVKIVHAINFGYFTQTQPRQRFFVDDRKFCVTNQCMYFTIKPSIRYSANVFCGILNSSVIQFFIRAHCYYDPQGRTRFFSRHMAKIPFAPPSDIDAAQMDTWVGDLTRVRSWIYAMIRLVRIRTVTDHVRNCTWQLSSDDEKRLEAVGDDWLDRLSIKPISEGHWVDKNVRWLGDKPLPHVLICLLRLQSLLQYAVDHLTAKIYHLSTDLLLELEQELGLRTSHTWLPTFVDAPDWPNRVTVMAHHILARTEETANPESSLEIGSSVPDTAL